MSTLYAEVTPTGTVINLVMWDGVTPFNVSPNTLVSAVGQPNAQVGGTYIGGVFTAPAALPPAQGIMFLTSPTTGTTVTLPNAPQPQAKLFAVFEPAAALAALTIDLPPNPQDGDELYILSTKTITTVTPVAAAGQSLINIPATFALAAGVSQHITWSAQLASWFRL